MLADSVGIVRPRKVTLFESPAFLELECGRRLGPVEVAYETYGQLNEARDNAVLICHALSGDAHVAGYHSEDDARPGWWDMMVGPGKGIDTNEYFVICSNVLGGCKGTTGPSSVHSETGRSWGLDFPVITGLDWVRLETPGPDRQLVLRLLGLIERGAFAGRVDEINYDRAVGFTLYGLAPGPVGVFLGLDGFEERLGRFGEMRRSLEKRGQWASAVDLAYDDRIVARLKPLGQLGVSR